VIVRSQASCRPDSSPSYSWLSPSRPPDLRKSRRRSPQWPTAGKRQGRAPRRSQLVAHRERRHGHRALQAGRTQQPLAQRVDPGRRHVLPHDSSRTRGASLRVRRERRRCYPGCLCRLPGGATRAGPTQHFAEARQQSRRVLPITNRAAASRTQRDQTVASFRPAVACVWRAA
jgi:hypothetical protein